MMQNIKPEGKYVIKDLETLKVISDPLRLSILEFLSFSSERGELLTVKQLADKLDLPPAKLYYHINLLEKHDLIQVADTRIVSGIIEKHYQVRALDFRIDKHLISRKDISKDEKMASLLSAASTILDKAYNDLEKSLHTSIQMADKDDDLRQMLTTNLTHELIRLTPERALTFRERLLELANEYKEGETGQDNEESMVYRFTLALIPCYHLSKN